MMKVLRVYHTDSRGRRIRRTFYSGGNAILYYMQLPHSPLFEGWRMIRTFTVSGCKR